MILSSEHRTASVSSEYHAKPDAIIDYNKRKGGVDTLDQCVATYWATENVTVGFLLYSAKSLT